jgi:predicted methyltransferase
MSLLGAAALAVVLTLSQAHAAPAVPAAITAAVADAARPDADKARDADRKPAEVLAFAGIKAGDRVADLLPGGGYFTRLFSKVVGAKGVVYALPPARRPDAPANMPDPAAAVNAIAADPNFSNVKVGVLDATAKMPEPMDVVWTSLNYHDLQNRPNADLAAFNKYVFDSLKPGGVYIVIDHAAEKGSGKRDTATLHRIDPDFVKAEVLAAGFIFDGESNALANPQDDHKSPNRDAGVRGKTDQFIFKFRKPKK